MSILYELGVGELRKFHEYLDAQSQQSYKRAQEATSYKDREMSMIVWATHEKLKYNLECAIEELDCAPPSGRRAKEIENVLNNALILSHLKGYNKAEGGKK